MRKLPGALGHEQSAVEESFSRVLEGAPEYPHYTRPPSYRGWGVPDVLVSGDHERVRNGGRSRAGREPSSSKKIPSRYDSATARRRIRLRRFFLAK